MILALVSSTSAQESSSFAPPDRVSGPSLIVSEPFPFVSGLTSSLPSA